MVRVVQERESVAGKGHPYHTGHLVTWVRCAQWGCSFSRGESEVPKFTIHFNTPKNQEVMIVYECHSVSQVPDTALRFITRRIHRNQKNCYTYGLLQWNEADPNSKGKRCIEQNPGDIMYTSPSPRAVVWIASNDSNVNVWWHIGHIANQRSSSEAWGLGFLLEVDMEHPLQPTLVTQVLVPLEVNLIPHGPRPPT